jgi:hypothetical protein
MKNSLRIFGLVIFTTFLTACGGGNSDSSGSNSQSSNNTSTSTPSTTVNSDIITKKCVRDSQNNVLAATDGCTVEFGNKVQTVLCVASGTSKIIKLTTGSNISLTTFKNSTGGISAGKITTNDLTIICA